MIYYRVTHSYKAGYTEKKDIGIYTTIENAQNAVDSLKIKVGFCDYPKGFKIKKTFRLIKPKLLDKTFWIDGFTTYSYVKGNKSVLNSKDENRIKAIFNFLLEEYGFDFGKADLGDAIDRNGNFFFYGPVYCYYLFNADICINILNLVQRQDYNIYITKELSLEQSKIRNGVAVENVYCYDWDSFAEKIKQELKSKGTLYNVKISQLENK